MVGRERLERSTIGFKVHEWPTEMYRDWAPPKESMQIIRERIALKISQRPDWYRKTPLKI